MTASIAYMAKPYVMVAECVAPAPIVYRQGNKVILRKPHTRLVMDYGQDWLFVSCYEGFFQNSSSWNRLRERAALEAI
jgi:hypothetical protein